MSQSVFLGYPPPNIKKWIEEHGKKKNDKLRLAVETTADYKKSGIYSAQRDDTSKPVMIDWGDGTVEQVNGEVSQKVHEYTTVGTFNVVVENIKSYAASANQDWAYTTSQNGYTLKEIVAMPDSVTSIGENTFYRCDALTSVTIPDSVTSIMAYAFSGCSSLTSVTIGNGVTSIGYNAFYGCNNALFDTMTIPGMKLVDGWVIDITNSPFGNLELTGGVRGIAERAFYNCRGLTSVTIPDSVTSISPGAFINCTSLQSFSVANDNPSYKSVSGLLLTKDSKILVAGINGNVTIPNSVTSIGKSAFNGCSGLTNVTIPDSVTRIGDSAFFACGLVSVTIPDSVTSIEYSAFNRCDEIIDITIGSGVTNIEGDVFYQCESTTDVYCYPNPVNLTWNEGGHDDFMEDGLTRCHVKTQYLSTYQTKFGNEVNVTFVGDLT